MYEAFYGLSERPFSLTPDPKFLYLSEKHKEAFAHLLFGIKNHNGFVMVSGEIGTGKTMICRTLLKQLDEDTEVAFIFNPSLSPDELLCKINEDFGIDSQASTPKGLIDELNEYLLERGQQGKNCVLVIDEAQNLSPSVLEQIRLLSNLETETQKLLQIVLIGQPELAENLQLPELRQLNQRITARYHLKALSDEETLQYIAYRLRVAGGRRKIRFSRKAVKCVYRYSKGVPRMINSVCDRALLIGYTQEVKDISAKIVKRAVHEIHGEFRIKRKREARIRRFLPGQSVIVAAALIVLVGHFIVRPLVEHLSQTDAAPSRDEVSTSVPYEEYVYVEPVVPEPKVEPAVPVAQEQRRTLAEVLNSLDSDTTRNAAALAVLRLWNMALLSGYPEDDSLDSLGNFAQENGLSFESLDISLDQILAVDLPAFVKMAGDRNSLWTALVEKDGTDLRITSGIGQTASVTEKEFRERYLNQAVILWHDGRPGTALLKEGMKGREVRRVQEQLIALGRLDGDVSDVYNEATVSAITKLQEEMGIIVDGKTGKQTRMVFASWSPEILTPSLVKSEEDPVPVDEADTLRASEVVWVDFEDLFESDDSEPEEESDAKEATQSALPEIPDLAGEPMVKSVDLPPEESSEAVTEGDLLPQAALEPRDTDANKVVTAPSPAGVPLVPRSANEIDDLGDKT